MATPTRLLLQRMQAVFPPLLSNAVKGQNGRIAVVGGSYEFTGAPYYSAISSLKVGGDLAHIFCSQFSSAAIKSYSPEIIAHPVFVSQREETYSQAQLDLKLQEWVRRIKGWESAINIWVLGPGMGRDPHMHAFFPRLVKNLPDDCVVVFDTDAIYFLCQHPELFKEMHRFKTIITPNQREMKDLRAHINVDYDAYISRYASNEEVTEVPPLKHEGDITMVIKGYEELVLGKNRSFILRTQGGGKRCGGIGNILAGAVGVCSYWDWDYGPVLASRIIRLATRTAYEKDGRGLSATSVISELPKTVLSMEN